MKTSAGEDGNGVFDFGFGELDTFSARSMVQVLLQLFDAESDILERVDHT